MGSYFNIWCFIYFKNDTRHDLTNLKNYLVSDDVIKKMMEKIDMTLEKEDFDYLMSCMRNDMQIKYNKNNLVIGIHLDTVNFSYDESEYVVDILCYALKEYFKNDKNYDVMKYCFGSESKYDDFKCQKFATIFNISDSDDYNSDDDDKN